jgi:hypothetical protein
VLYDLIFVAHIIAGLISILVLFAMKSTAVAIVNGVDEKVRLPRGRNWAARTLHLIPITGFATLGASASQTDPISFHQVWIFVGVACYLAMSGILEAKVLPTEQRFVAGVAAKSEAAQMNRLLDYILGFMTIATIAMLIQWG